MIDIIGVASCICVDIGISTIHEALDRTHRRWDLPLNDWGIFLFKDTSIIVLLHEAHQFWMQKFATFSNSFELTTAWLNLTIALFDSWESSVDSLTLNT